jgi:6-phosphogluconolactonase
MDSHVIEIVAGINELFRRGAEEFVFAAKEAIAARGSFTVALSGGSTPKGLFSLLATEEQLRSNVQWDKIDFFWGDERHVPPDNAESNYRMANESLLSKVPVDPARVRRIKGELVDTQAAATDYERALRSRFGDQLPSFDLVFLGMGPDGHTASLFPGTKALHATNRLVVSNWVGKFATDRITMTAPVLNNAASILFLVGGDDKAPALKSVLEGPFEPEQLPAQLIHPKNGKLLWLVDQAAARMLASKS